VTATNHALSGALIGATITQPILAIPLAFISHFGLDAIPHFGLDNIGGHTNKKNTKLFHKILLIDAVFLATVFVWLLFAGANWLTFVCLIAAGSPDFVWAYRYIFQEKFGKNKPHPKNWFSNFHAKIQTQTISGIYVELPLAAAFVVLLSNAL
jgi:hypothetical protein